MRMKEAILNFKKFNYRVLKDEINISDAARIWGIHQGKVREKMNNEYWEAQFDSDHDDDIM